MAQFSFGCRPPWHKDASSEKAGLPVKEIEVKLAGAVPVLVITTAALVP
jgi:hypothetical protein